jgi:uncharacterized membrane protein
MFKSLSIKNLLENTIFIWLGIILILSLAGNNIDLPNWVRVIGRSHPLLLHFPIVLLLTGLIFFWVPNLLRKPELREIGEYLLLAGINFAGITVIAGLILGQEDYEGKAIVWHQWAGVGVFFAAVPLYFLRYKNQQFLKASTLVIGAGIIATGHWGANLTHGEDFLLSPIQPSKIEIIPLADAEVFKDMVQPIFETKCVSCHKEGKVKGELRLDELAGIKKGGEDGPFVLAGDMEKSMLIQRIHLSMDEKKHMPPKNKLQLTQEELIILSEWVKSGASFEEKVIQTDPNGELYRLASAKFESNRVYEFQAAEEDDILELNNFYRSVQPLYPESPALEATYFGASAFDPNSLSELKKVKTQLVKLSLNKMPLSGVELSFLSEFPNLEEVQMNFSDLRSKEIEALTKIPNLKKLAISGNPLQEKDVEAISKMTSLENLYVWQNGLDESQKNQLRNSLSTAEIDFGFNGADKIYTLNSPKIEIAEKLFQDSVEMTIKHPIASVEIRYSLDGAEPDSIESLIYSRPIWIKSTSSIQAKAYAKEWKGSPSDKAIALKASFTPISDKLEKEPSESYNGNGVATLFDLTKGSIDHQDKKWLGFQNNPLEVEMNFEAKTQPKSISISLLYNEAAYIVPPQRIEIWAENNGIWKQVISEIPPQSEKYEPARLDVLTYSLPDFNSTKLKLKITPLARLPKWHQGNGAKGWLFVDEILVN